MTRVKAAGAAFLAAMGLGCGPTAVSPMKPDDLTDGRALVAEGKWAEAVEPLTRAVASCGRADAKAQLLALRAKCHRMLGNLDQALADCDEALADEEDFEARIERGLARRKKGDAAGAAKDFAVVRASNPRFTPPVE